MKKKKVFIHKEQPVTVAHLWEDTHEIFHQEKPSLYFYQDSEIKQYIVPMIDKHAYFRANQDKYDVVEEVDEHGINEYLKRNAHLYAVPLHEFTDAYAKRKGFLPYNTIKALKRFPTIFLGAQQSNKQTQLAQPHIKRHIYEISEAYYQTKSEKPIRFYAVLNGLGEIVHQDMFLAVQNHTVNGKPVKKAHILRYHELYDFIAQAYGHSAYEEFMSINDVFPSEEIKPEPLENTDSLDILREKVI